MAAVVGSSLLDSGVEYIPVPILQPKSTDINPNGDETQSSEIAVLDRRLENLMIPVLEPARKPGTLPRARQSSNNSAAATREIPKVVPWDGRIRWTVKGCSIFDSQKDETDACHYTKNFFFWPAISNLWVFQYGLRYIPAKVETNTYRTVKIEGLPADIIVNHVLSVIRGEIYSARLFDTTAIVGYNTVIVVFVQERGARNLVQSARKGLRVGLGLAKVTLVNTPTYPMSTEMDELLKRGYSRCLVVSNVSEASQMNISCVLQRSAYYPYIERIDASPSSGLLSIRFHCIKSAVAARLLLKGHPIFWKCTIICVKECEDGKLVVSKA